MVFSWDRSGEPVFGLSTTPDEVYNVVLVSVLWHVTDL